MSTLRRPRSAKSSETSELMSNQPAVWRLIQAENARPELRTLRVTLPACDSSSPAHATSADGISEKRCSLSQAASASTRRQSVSSKVMRMLPLSAFTWISLMNSSDERRSSRAAAMAGAMRDARHDYYNKGIFPCQPVFIVNFTKILHSFLFNFSNKTAKNHHISRKNSVFFRKIIVFSHKKLVFYVDYCHNKVTIKFSGGAAWIFQV